MLIRSMKRWGAAVLVLVMIELSIYTGAAVALGAGLAALVLR